MAGPRVLVATDFSPASKAAFRRGLMVAARLGTPLEILHVWQSNTQVPVTVAGPQAKEALKRFVTATPDRGGVELRRRTEYGDPFYTVFTVALRGAFDLVALGMHGKPDPEVRALGSVAQRISEAVAAAVLV